MTTNQLNINIEQKRCLTTNLLPTIERMIQSEKSHLKFLQDNHPESKYIEIMLSNIKTMEIRKSNLIKVKNNLT